MHAPEPSPPLVAAFDDRFDRDELGSGYRSLSKVWHINNGELCGRGAENQGVWLRRRLPLNARIEFEARSDSPDGDIKFEAWGDGVSGASGNTYDHASGYVGIFGGWKNQLHAIARLNEHGADRKVVQITDDGDDPRTQRVVPGRRYRFRIERRDGYKLSMWVDSVQLLEFDDRQPLAGAGHDHFGFNDWATPVCFDNLKITPL